eukprot:g5459.t1
MAKRPSPAREAASALLHEEEEKRWTCWRRFSQQKIKSWHPLVTPKIVVRFSYFVACFLFMMGGIIYASVANVLRVSIDYTDMDSASHRPARLKVTDGQGFLEGDPTEVPVDSFDVYGGGAPPTSPDAPTRQQTTVFQISLVLKEEIPDTDTLWIYYGITGFFQNLRRFIFSKDATQLSVSTYPSVHAYREAYNNGDSCDRAVEEDARWLPNWAGEKVLRYPCGLIGKWMFTDGVLLEERLSQPDEGTTNNSSAVGTQEFWRPLEIKQDVASIGWNYTRDDDLASISPYYGRKYDYERRW